MTFQIILDFISFFVMGLSVGFMICDYWLIKPLVKQRNQAMDGWVNSVKQHLDFLTRVLGVDSSGLDVQVDGSAKSPFPITNFKKKDE
jgi:hypothetical protein